MSGVLSAEVSLRAAICYATKFGFAVFPAGGADGKKPLTQHGVKDAGRDVEAIRSLWPAGPCNVAIAAGAVSGIWVLDLDGEEGLETFGIIERRYGPLPPSPRQLTPGGDMHLFFAHAEGLRNRVRCLPGVDIRTDGGYVIAPPSVAPGRARPWAWDVDHHVADVQLAPAPRWLVDLLSEETSRPIDDDVELPLWLAIALASVPQGQRNDTAARITGHLLRRWCEPRLAFALLRAWNTEHCRPPLPAVELARTFNSIFAKELRRRGVL